MSGTPGNSPNRNMTGGLIMINDKSQLSSYIQKPRPAPSIIERRSPLIRRLRGTFSRRTPHPPLRGTFSPSKDRDGEKGKWGTPLSLPPSSQARWGEKGNGPLG